MERTFGQPEREPTPIIELGMGFNWFDYFGSGGHYARWKNYPLDEPLYPALDDEASWSALEAGLDALNPGWLRFGLPPDPHVGKQGEPNLNTIHMERLNRVARWAESRKKPILLDFFMIPEFYEFDLPAGVTHPGEGLIGMAARDNRAFARNFVAPLFNELIHERGLTAIRYFNPVNEPMEYGVYQTPGDTPSAIVHYVEMYRELREALDAIGLSRERVALVGMDTIEPLRQLLHMHAQGVDIDAYIDAYSIHHYNLRLDHQSPRATPDNTPDYFDVGIAGVIEREDREVLRYCRERGKPLWALEMGSFYNGKFSTPEGVASFETTLIVSEAILRAANMGISTFCIWSLMNTDNVDGFWSILKVGEGEWKPCGYPFALYRALGRHLRPGARIHPLDAEDPIRPRHIHGSWAVSAEGPTTLMLVNDHPEAPRTLNLEIPEGIALSDNAQTYCYTEGVTTPQPVPLPPGTLSLQLPPFSLTLIE